MKRLKLILQTWIVKHLFRGLTEQDVIAVRGGSLWVGDEKATPEVASKYKEQAIALQNSELWKTLDKQIQFTANRLMFEKAKNTDDLFFGKAMIYSLDLINKYLSLLAKIKS